MKLMEMKNRLAIDTAKLVCKNIGDVVFIGGTALNTFYMDYRFSEDVDFGYTAKNRKPEIEGLLRKHGYRVEKTNYRHRDIVSLDEVSIKVDVVKYELKIGSIVEGKIGQETVRTLSIDEFSADKIICFFTREHVNGLAKDAYDLYQMEKEYKSVIETAKKARKILKKNISSYELNLNLFCENREKIEEAINPSLKKDVEYEKVAKFLKRLRGVVHG